MSATDDDGKLEWDLYLTVIRLETQRILELAQDLDQPVPSCPGWTVRDLLEHLAGVYRHKVETMRSAVEPPWPLEGLDTSDVRHAVAEESATLLAELSERGPREVRHTWYADDPSNGFWFRRMAHEATVHRVDAEQSAGHAPVTVDEDVAEDGIAEFLSIMLGGPWWDDDEDPTAYPVDATVVISTKTRSWTVTFAASHIDVIEGRQPADLVVEGPSDALYLWLWGRTPATGLALEGRADLVTALEGRFAEAAD